MQKFASLTKVFSIVVLSFFVISSFNYYSHSVDLEYWELPLTPDVLALRERIDSIIEFYEPYDYDIGLRIMSLCLPQTFYELNIDKPLIPASNLKLITTAVAYAKLGADFTWQTHFYTNTTGNLYIKASGDPTWSDMLRNGSINRAIRSIADSLRANGLSTIDGDIVIDSGSFHEFNMGVGWREGNRLHAFSAMPSAIAFNENTVQIQIRPTTPGNPANISLFPVNAGFNIINNVNTTTNRRQQGFSFVADSLSNSVKVSGSIWEHSRTQHRTIATPVPEQYALYVIRERLREHGITVKGDILYENFSERDPTLRHFTELFSIHSAPIAGVMNEINKASNNFMANQLFLTIGELYNDAQQTENIIKTWLSTNNVPVDSLRMYDGSGLSYKNRSTVNQLTRILRIAHNSEWRDDFYSSMAISGRDGTLRNAFNCEVLNRQVHAKTGFIVGARGLTGFIRTADGEMLGFSLMVNKEGSRLRNFNRIAERILLELATFSRDECLLAKISETRL